MVTLKQALIKSAALNLKEYLDKEHCIDVDVIDLQEFINIDLGWLIDAVNEQCRFYEEFISNGA